MTADKKCFQWKLKNVNQFLFGRGGPTFSFRWKDMLELQPENLEEKAIDMNKISKH